MRSNHFPLKGGTQGGSLHTFTFNRVAEVVHRISSFSDPMDSSVGSPSPSGGRNICGEGLHRPAGFWFNEYSGLTKLKPGRFMISRTLRNHCELTLAPQGRYISAMGAANCKQKAEAIHAPRRKAFFSSTYI